MPLLATWNINSVRARLPLVLEWAGRVRPDILLFQEIKCETASFPEMEFKSLGYECLIVGQKSYNGVALLSRQPIVPRSTALPGDDADAQARYVEADVGNIRVIGLYLPNGNPIGTDKFAYKLGWMERLITRAKDLLAQGIPFVMAGDFNVIPSDDDVFDPKAFAQDALTQPEVRRLWRTLLNLGLYDAFALCHPQAERAWTFWDYQAGAWQRDLGLRIDFILLSPGLADRLVECAVDKEPRGRDKASDHTPVWCRLNE
ncbi:MAG: exodeoxyribonuclease III [Alphaproteobacteria bacterium]|nr:exodeoxyribonuclease III [Alphaproteobacteria bacterium]